MKPTKTLSAFIYATFVIALFLSFMFSSCRKIKDAEINFDNYWEQKFFQVPENASEALKAVISDIKNQNDKFHFASRLAQKYGLPSWSKSVSNAKTTDGQNNPNARGATTGSPELFLIPFRGADSSVTSYLACARNDNEFTYRFYKKNYLSRLYAANDTIRFVREGVMSIFGFFEKRINNRDSITIPGIYNKTFKDVVIKINDVQVNTTGRSLDVGLSILEVCYSVSGGDGGGGGQGGGDGGGSGSGGGAQVRTMVDGLRCIRVGVYGSLIDLGFTSSAGYTSGGGGSSGGGSTAAIVSRMDSNALKANGGAKVGIISLLTEYFSHLNLILA